MLYVFIVQRTFTLWMTIWLKKVILFFSIDCMITLYKPVYNEN